MDIRSLQETWDALARDDPLGFILGYPERRHDWDLDEFLATGERELDDVLEWAQGVGLPLRRERALDFGCGVGRLTQAMCGRFERADGVDIAPTMIAAAERLNRHAERCTYHLNEAESLALFADESFDFVYSWLVLQHIRPDLGRRYVGELVRVLRPGGLLVFQVPHDRDTLPKLPRKAVIAELAPDVRTLELPAASTRTIRVRVRNAGAAAWPGHQGYHQSYRAINVGNHWRSPDNRMIQLDDGRTPLPHDVTPGGEVELELAVTAPARPGNYVLELDLVQEGVAWFAQRRRLSRRRTRPARIPVLVTGDPPAAGGDGVPEPEMEMHAIPRPDVERILAAGGARLLEVRANDAAGPGWISLRYAATKDR